MRSKLYLIVTLFTLLAVTSCKNKKTVPPFDRSFSQYINSFTSGIISKKSTIRVQFRSPVDSTLFEGEIKDDLFDFSPDVEGQVVWKDRYSLEFIPAENLKPGEVYQVELDLSKIFEVPDSLETFEFGFQVLKPDYDWGMLQLKASPEDQMKWYILEGTVLTADEEEVEEIQQLLKATVGGKRSGISWENMGYKRYKFTVDSLERKETAYKIELDVNQSLAGAEDMPKREQELPALGDFRFLGYDIINTGDRHILLKFSDPIDPKQDLQGLVSLGSAAGLKVEIENTSIKIFPNENMYGKKVLAVHAGIKNILGYKFKDEISKEVIFYNEKPQVKIIGEGNIIPSGENLLLPFQAISLKAVDVKVIRIDEGNVLQFLQNNRLAGERELYRVGEIVATEKIDLKSENSLLDWNTYSIDLAKLMKPQPGAIYRVYLSFQKEYSLYSCENVEVSRNESDEDYYEDEYWYYDEYYYDYGYGSRDAYNHSDYYFNYPAGYKWEERDNPCHVSYYRSEQFAVRNVLATDLGIIVKNGDDGTKHIVVTNLKTAEPVQGAEVKALTYQQRVLVSQKTDDNGWTVIKTEKTPYFIQVEKDGMKNYLRLERGASQSLSNFDVSGQKIQKGLKGFIYGERGVWRPGDTIFLNFILEDEMQNLPKGHPVRFELSDPNGITVDRQVSTKANGRIYNFPTYTEPAAMTGNYLAKVSVGGVSFSQRVRVETVKPNRLNIELDFKDEVLLSRNGNFSAEASVKWLTGVEASGSRLDIQASLSAINNPFEDYKGYHFRDPVYNFYYNDEQVFDGEMGADGKATINGSFGDLSNAPGMLNAKFLTKAFEGGGDFSTEVFQTKVAPYTSFTGIKMPKSKNSYYLHTNETYPLEIRTLDPLGKPVSSDDVEVKVYRIGYYGWYNSNGEGLARYINNDVTYLIQKGNVKTVNGKATYNLKISNADWGRMLVRVCDKNSGHCTAQTTYFYWPGNRRQQGSDQPGANLLTFTTDKNEYNVDEEIVARIPVSKGAKVLVTVENGSGVLKKEWRTAESDMLEYRTKAVEGMAPNIYISAWLLQPHSQTTNDRPMRLYGVVPVLIKDPATELHPEIKSSDVWRPETTVEVEVSETSGKEMYYTLAIVDEGLLNLTGFKTPDPWSSFFAREALGVQTWDMYEDVLGAFGGRLEQVYAVGGDGSLTKKDLNNQNRFKPMVRHLGPFKLTKGKENKHKIKVPNYIGSVRIMVVAAGGEQAYGSSEKAVAVRKPLMVLSSLPRLLSPGDEIALPATVFAMEEKIKKVNLKLKVEGEVSIEGDSSEKLEFAKTGQQIIDFKLKVKENIGTAKVRIEASSGREKAYDETELLVRLPNPPIKNITSFVLEPGEERTVQYEPAGLAGTNSQTLEATTIPPINLTSRLKYLLGYPHGCTEQTISRVFPLLYLEDIMDLDDAMKQTRKRNIQIAINKIARRQFASGGVRYWPNGRIANEYISSYAGHFLMEAEHKGFQVPAGMLERWKKFQKQVARAWKPYYRNSERLYNDYDQAYRLYTLALAGEPEIGAMNRLRETKNISRVSMWQLAGAYLIAGQKDAAVSLAAKAGNMDGNYYGYWYYGGALRNDAIHLRILKALGEDRKAMLLAKEMSERLSSQRWFSTHSVAIALPALIETFGEFAKGGDMEWSFKGDGERKDVSTKRLMETYTVKNGVDEPHTYSIRNNGKIPVTFKVVDAGIPMEYNVEPVSSNLSMEVKYMYPNGEPLDITKLQQGQDFIAEVSIQKTSNIDGYENMALTQIFPTGWEIINTRLLDMENNELSQPDYQDIRDDRVYTYFDLRRKNVRFRLNLNATYAGKYYLPPVQVEDMYDDEIQARNSGKWVEVIRK